MCLLWWNLVQTPGPCLVKAAKAGVVDNLQGSLDALTWGNTPSLGSGGHFEIIYSGEVHLIVFFT